MSKVDARKTKKESEARVRQREINMVLERGIGGGGLACLMNFKGISLLSFKDKLY